MARQMVEMKVVQTVVTMVEKWAGMMVLQWAGMMVDMSVVWKAWS